MSRVLRNIVINNLTGIIGDSASFNLIYAPPTYVNTGAEACVSGANVPTCYLPTTGVNLNCQPAKSITDNGILNVSVGVANIPSGSTIPSSNLITGVAASTSTCTATTN